MRLKKIFLIIYLLSVSTMIAFCRDKDNHDKNRDITKALEILAENDPYFFIADSTANKIANLEGVSEDLKSEILCSDTLTITKVTTYNGILSEQIFICNSYKVVSYQLCKISQKEPMILWDCGHVCNYLDYDVKFNYPDYDAFDLLLSYIYNWDMPIPDKILKDVIQSFDAIMIKSARIVSFPDKTVFNLYSDTKSNINCPTTSTYTLSHE